MTSVEVVATRGPYRNGVRRREQILESASVVFAELGYSGGSIRTIAERVGSSPAILMRHFGSKEGLLTAVLEDWAVRTSAAAGLEAYEGLGALLALRDLMAFHVDNRGLLELFLTMVSEASNPQHPARPFVEMWRFRTHEMWSSALSRAGELGEITVMTEEQIGHEVRILTAVADGLELQWLLDPTVDLVGIFSYQLDQMITRWKAGL